MTLAISPLDLTPEGMGYPADLETLVDGVTPPTISRAQAEVPAACAGGSDDMTATGVTFVSGRANRHTLGRPERLRRLHEVRRYGA
jgi:hypothetical protein